MLVRLGAKLRARRKLLKVTATSAAEAAGMSRVTWFRIEKGEPSVTAGAYMAALLALGLHVEILAPDAATKAADHQTLIPVRIRLDQYPKLKELAWHVQGTQELRPRDALDIYEGNWHHIEPGTLSPRSAIW